MSEFLIDGNWIDMATLGVAACYAGLRSILTRRWRVESIVSDVSYGVSIFPMFLLAMTVVSSSAINALMNGNKIVISLAGLISLIVILKRTFENPAAANIGS